MFVLSTEEKKATKRTFQKIQEEEEEEEDDYRAHYSPKDLDGSGPQLVWMHFIFWNVLPVNI